MIGLNLCNFTSLTTYICDLILQKFNIAVHFWKFIFLYFCIIVFYHELHVIVTHNRDQPEIYKNSLIEHISGVATLGLTGALALPSAPVAYHQYFNLSHQLAIYYQFVQNYRLANSYT